MCCLHFTVVDSRHPTAEHSSGLSLNCFSNFTSGLHKNDPSFITANTVNMCVVCNVSVL